MAGRTIILADEPAALSGVESINDARLTCRVIPRPARDCGSACTRAGYFGRAQWLRWANFFQSALAQYIRIALTAFRLLDNLVCYRLPDIVVAVSDPQGYANL